MSQYVSIAIKRLFMNATPSAWLAIMLAASIVQAGEVSGRMPEVFESLSGYYEWLDQLMGDIRQALNLSEEVPIIPVSARSGVGIKELWGAIAPHLEASKR